MTRTDGAPATSSKPSSTGIWVTLTLAVLSMVGPFTIDSMFPAFTQMGIEFGADEAAMQQVTGVYLAAFAVMSIFHGPISDAAGRKPVMIGGLLGFTAASIACALAPNLPFLLAGRLLQGVFAGGATIISRVVIRDLASGAAAQRLMSHVIMIFSVAPAIAPVVGGWILIFGSWRLVFWFITVYAAVAITLTLVVLPETQPPDRRLPMRAGQVLGSLIYVARQGPLLRISLVTALVYSAQFVYIFGAPIIMVRLLGQGEQDFWKLFFPIVGGTMLGAWLSARASERMTRRRLLDVGILATLAATSLNLVIAWLAPVLPWVLIGPPLIALALGTIFPVLNLEILDSVPDRRGSAGSFGTFGYLLFNAILTAFIIPLVSGSLVQLAWCALTLPLLGAVAWIWHRNTTPSGQPDAIPS